MMTNKWLPDWKDETAYPDIETTTQEKWAWEFLRKNPEYQRDFLAWEEKGNNCLRGKMLYADEYFGSILEEHQKIHDSTLKKYQEIHKKMEMEFSHKIAEIKRKYPDSVETIDYKFSKPKELEIEIPPELVEYERLHSKLPPMLIIQGDNGETIRTPSPFRFLMDKYGLSEYFVYEKGELIRTNKKFPDPANNEFRGKFADLLFNNVIIAFMSESKEKGWDISINVKYEEMCIGFRLDLPIGVQIEKAEKMLKDWQKNFKAMGGEIIEKRLQVNKYPIYLRLLDAKAKGVPDKERIKILFPEVSNEYPDFKANKRVANDLKAANKLRDQDYRYIPYPKIKK
uniref:Transcriptional regulator-like domain-containing protein n=1 Tax=Candidatus Kentrum sp. TUN TaxID=2126343 RepID=A0A450ZK43_9GAMM|nr:MAG: hypothetical protein BECKTUN1418D_GA0071000_10209 [Candidatus Kentron sp. TUN]